MRNSSSAKPNLLVPDPSHSFNWRWKTNRKLEQKRLAVSRKGLAGLVARTGRFRAYTGPVRSSLCPSLGAVWCAIETRSRLLRTPPCRRRTPPHRPGAPILSDHHHLLGRTVTLLVGPAQQEGRGARTAVARGGRATQNWPCHASMRGFRGKVVADRRVRRSQRPHPVASPRRIVPGEPYLITRHC
jgi:hypothetical protein